MSSETSSPSAIGRKRRPRSQRLLSDSESPEGSPVVRRRRRTRKRIIAPSSDSESEVEPRRRRQKTSAAEPVIVSESENDSASPEDGNVCPICLGRLYDSYLQGRPDSCAHTFCFECIKTWTEKNSTCVLCRAPITKLKVVLRDNVLEEIPVDQVSLKLDETSVPIPSNYRLCYTCRNYGENSLLARCGYCAATYHLQCLNPPLLNTPRGLWSCPQCDVESSEGENEEDLYVPDEGPSWYAYGVNYAERGRRFPRSARQSGRRADLASTRTRRRARPALMLRI